MKINSTEIKHLEPINTIAISHIGDYKNIGFVFEKLSAWAEANNLLATSPRMAGVYHDDPRYTPVEKLRSEACVEDNSGIEPGEGMYRYTIGGGKFFVMQIEVAMSEYSKAWTKAYAEFDEKGYEYDMRDHHELYISCAGDNQEADSPWIVELCIPMK